jgi:hypothetical protein
MNHPLQDSQDVPELPRQEDLLEDFGVAPVGEFSNKNGVVFQDSLDSITRSPKHGEV